MKGTAIPASLERFGERKELEGFLSGLDDRKAKLLTGCPVNEFGGFEGPDIEDVIYFPWGVEGTDKQSVNRNEVRKQTLVAIEKASMALNNGINVYVDASGIDQSRPAARPLVREDSVLVGCTIGGFLARNCKRELNQETKSRYLKHALLHGYGGLSDRMLGLKQGEMKKVISSWIEDVKEI